MRRTHILSWLLYILHRYLLYLTLAFLATLSVYFIVLPPHHTSNDHHDNQQTFFSDFHGNQSYAHDNLIDRLMPNEMRPKRGVKVLVAGYYRSGSTMTGEMFAAHNDTMYLYEFSRPTIIQWYEAQSRLDQLPGTADESLLETAIVGPLLAAFRCDMSSVPDQMLVNYFWVRKSLGWPTRRFLQCAHAIPRCAMQVGRPCTPSVTQLADPTLLHLCYSAMYAQPDEVKVVPWNATTWNDVIKPSIARYRDCATRRAPQVRRCAALLAEDCGRASVRAVKEVRLDLRLLHPLLSRDPDIRVVHLVRDPRGIMASTFSLNAVRHICVRMLRDLDSLQMALTSHPGCCILVRYEDVAVDPDGQARRVYRHTGLDFHSYYHSWMQRLNSSTHNSGSGGTYRTNMSAEAADWTTKLSITTQLKVRLVAECDEVIRRLGYDNQ